MKKSSFIFATGAALLLAVTSSANASQGLYVGGLLGVAVPVDSEMTDSTAPGITLDIESDAGIALGAVLGYDLGNSIRIEGEISLQKNDLDTIGYAGIAIPVSGDFSTMGFGVNGYYDFVNQSALTPFISAGVGLVDVEVSDFGIPGSGIPNASDDDTVFSYNIGAGIGYAMTERATVDIRYRYCGMSDAEFDTTTIEIASHNFYMGVRFAL